MAREQGIAERLTDLLILCGTRLDKGCLDPGGKSLTFRLGDNPVEAIRLVRYGSGLQLKGDYRE